MEQNTIIKIKRGAEANLPTLNDGELAYTRDEKNLYIGTPDGNEKILGSGGGQEGVSAYRLEFETITLADTMRFDFAYAAGYDEVDSLVVSLVGQGVENSGVELIAEAVKEEDKYTHVIVYAKADERVNPDNVRVSMQAVCFKGTDKKNEV